MRFHPRHFLLATAICCVAFSAPRAQQDAASPGTPAGAERMRLLVDGSRDPALIPDATAIPLLMRSLASRAERWDHAPHPAQASPLGLSAADLSIVEDTLARLRQRTRTLQQDAAGAAAIVPRTAASTAAVRQAVEGQDAAALDAYEELRGRLSPDGAASLEAYIQREKRNIRILEPATTVAR